MTIECVSPPSRQVKIYPVSEAELDELRFVGLASVIFGTMLGLCLGTAMAAMGNRPLATFSLLGSFVFFFSLCWSSGRYCSLFDRITRTATPRSWS